MNTDEYRWIAQRRGDAEEGEDLTPPPIPTRRRRTQGAAEGDWTFIFSPRRGSTELAEVSDEDDGHDE